MEERKPPVVAAATTPTEKAAILQDPGKAMMKELVVFMVSRLKTQDAELLTPSFLEVCRKLLNDNAITFAQVRRGDFGEVAKAAAEDFPFPEEAREFTH